MKPKRSLGTKVQVISPYHQNKIMLGTIERIKKGDASPYPIVVKFEDGTAGQFKHSEIEEIENETEEVRRTYESPGVVSQSSCSRD